VNYKLATLLEKAMSQEEQLISGGWYEPEES
jgi:hypothetical protein